MDQRNANGLCHQYVATSTVTVTATEINGAEICHRGRFDDEADTAVPVIGRFFGSRLLCSKERDNWGRMQKNA
ncbi:hypothetical protein LHU53_18755 [Rhodoferax sp. U2-2l]|uniref:hypothetical protein n=1 Tax=Rhodoferax sp. U2-2l TaxID=2884000 RepID=UPI001D0A45E0|nr:hypothetical protein [Rhodoferax sp. U2-2l]MCB8748935.1 hypothetical protein [Rhodoferax sp. U2-2l]